jgi:hypothetical protein
VSAKRRYDLTNLIHQQIQWLVDINLRAEGETARRRWRENEGEKKRWSHWRARDGKRRANDPSRKTKPPEAGGRKPVAVREKS